MTYPDAPQQPPSYPPAPGFGAPPPQQQSTRLRGRVPRLLGWILLALAVALFVVGAVVVNTKSLSKVTSFQRVPIPTDSSTVTFDHTGKYVAYYEAANVNNDIRQVPAVGVAIESPKGTVTRLTKGYKEQSDGKIKIFTYDYKGHKGVALYQLTITETGRYKVATRPTSSTATDAKIAFGKDISGGAIAGGILIVVGVIALVAAIVLLIVGYVKRSRHKKELRAPAYAGGPPPGYPQQGPPPGYPQQGYPQQGPPPGYPQQGYPQQGPPPGYPQQYGDPQQGPPSG